MATVVVVPAGDELEDGQLRVTTGRPNVAVDQLILEGGQEALGHRVIPARSWSSDALACLVSRQQFAVRAAGVLDAAVGVMDQSWIRAARPQRHLERIGGQYTSSTYGELL